MDRLKKIIQEQQTHHDQEPMEGHFERFAEKLEANQQKKRKLFPMFLKAASIAILFILSSLWVYERFTEKQSTETQISIADLSPEYKEAEMYYTHLVSEKNNEIENILSNDSTEYKIISNELTEMDSLYTSLSNDLQANPNDKRVINSIIEYYQVKVEVLNRILNKLENVKPQKQYSHEKIEV
ncbi:MAG: hypothetical protein C0594_07310 [Marinilabiliales bacterium]|nr:MAG: hypothetical protein C0594_07310 [Marinilabiliales bacterium]